jgi:hypothetical protein
MSSQPPDSTLLSTLSWVAVPPLALSLSLVLFGRSVLGDVGNPQAAPASDQTPDLGPAWLGLGLAGLV